ncbi:putative bifunctional diguanylate cyclase/phosphodiesterase [Actinophytocola gossypii]|uniref:EAL domain-containing protein n=1 Tax=Actinophytocola gossypii TaxID=2812003 RepID=A0ABT2J7L0_9PSEU|nr:EAL domain-containing protein [Actinophytocola gossypii]MCT2583828.1 EAL domain-containing protein [Actinophytocola gossypii]
MDRSELVSEWAGALARVIYIARSADEVEHELKAALDDVLHTLTTAPFDAEPVSAVAKRLVGLGLTSSECVERSITVLGTGMPQLPELAGIDDAADKLVHVFSAMARGFSDGMRKKLYDEQEGLTRALIQARENAERALSDSEARFEEIFTSSSVGMAISALDGTLIRTNRALADILGHRRGKLPANRVEDLFHAEDADYLKMRYQVLLEEDALPFRERRRLLRQDGDDAVVFLSASVLRDPDGTPRYYVTSAEDVSDKQLLEGQLQFQATHDALTGLANRPRFLGRLEEALRGKRSHEDVTVFHLDLDGFRAINNGLGREAGDRLLHAVAARLRDVFDGEKATVARFDGDEFAVLVENTATTPSVEMLAARINDDLAEPVYLGERGIAATASIAVMHRPPPDTLPVNVLRATDITLQRLKSSGRRQWGLVDLEANERDRARFSLASSMPGAWENGEIDLEYQPLVSSETRELVAVQALLRWDHEEQGPLDHEQCLDALSETGLALPIGRWILERGCAQLRTWSDRHDSGVPKLYVELSSDLAADPDLIATVRDVLADTGVEPDRLRLGMPVRALCQHDGMAEDNLEVLQDVGVAVVLYEFGNTRGDLACLEDLPVVAVKMSSGVVSRVRRQGEDSLFTRSIRQLVPLVRENGTQLIVGDVHTGPQLDWWRDIGADLVQGEHTGAAGTPGETERRFDR